MFFCPEKTFFYKISQKILEQCGLKYSTSEGQWCEVLSPLLNIYLPILPKYLHDWSGDLKRHALPLHGGIFYCCSSRNTGDMMQRLHAQKRCSFFGRFW